MALNSSMALPTPTSPTASRGQWIFVMAILSSGRQRAPENPAASTALLPFLILKSTLQKR